MTANGLSTLYHVGIVVPDLAEAQRTFTRQLGITWGPVLRVDATELRDGAGQDVVLPSTICYSVDAPHLELIEEVPGSVWVRNEFSNLHHIGFWSDDLSSASEGLTTAGCPLQLCGREQGAAPRQFAYHRNELGVRIEIVDAALRPFMDSYLFQPPQS